MGKQVLIFLINIVLLGISHAETTKPLDLPACQAARAKTAYTGVVEIPQDVKSFITAYKKSWTDLCDRKPSASVHQTLSVSKTLEDKFNPIYSSKQYQTADGETDWKKTEAVHDYLEKGLPKFIPAFEGSIIEYEYFRPRFSDFKQMAAYGNAEDKLFFQLYDELRGNSTLHPWYEMTWDHGGCLRFGEYDWIQAFKQLKKAKSIKSVQYQAIISEQESALTETLENLFLELSDKNFSPICTCKKKDAVSTDLEELVTYLENDKGHANLVSKLQKTLKAIKARQIPVKSQNEKRCSGG